MNTITHIKKKYRDYGISGILSAIPVKLIVMVKTKIMLLYLKNTTPTFGLNTNEIRKQKVIVSLTSFPSRFPYLHICIKSLLRQTYKPDKILLYLGSDSKETDLNDNITELTKYGLEIIFKSDNYKAHNKYLFAMQEHKDDIIITVDDDIIYDKELLESLIKSYEEYPNAVSARRVHKIQIKNEKLELYNNFLFDYRLIKEPSLQLLATGVGGVLYPPNIMPEETFNKEHIKKLCLGADDIWLKFMQIVNKIPVAWVETNVIKGKLMELPNGKTCSLNKENINNVRNDFYIFQLQEYYDIPLIDLLR